MTPLGNKLDEEVTLRGITLWGRDTSLRFDDDSAGDTVVMLKVLIDFAGDRKTSPRTIFPWLLAEDNPIISW